MMHAWHTINKEELILILETSEHGLQKQESAKRLAEYGPNELQFDVQSFWSKLLEPFKSVFVLVLAFAAIVSYTTHEKLGTYIILAVLIVNALIFYVQQYMTARVLRTLRRTAEQQCTVLRAGEKQTVSIRELVPGDVVLLSEGQHVPADLRILHEDNIMVDESALTGESLPVEKHGGIVPEHAPLYERHNMLFRGTYVVAGSAIALVVETGMQTEFGAIAHLAAERDVKSPMQHKIERTVSMLIRATAVVAVVVVALAVVRGIELGYAVVFALTVAVAMVPEGLPIALTVTIVFGMRRMAKKKALVRSFRAIEDIGQLTTIATDKTGTLTKNKLSVVDSWQLHSYQPVLPVLAHAIGDHTNINDPLDHAFVQFMKKKSHRSVGLLLRTYPFDQSIRMSGAAWGLSKGAEKLTVSIKGAPEHILRLSDLSVEERHAAESKMHHYASQGYRVIALAVADLSALPSKLDELTTRKLTFVGFVACADELRPEAKSAIASAQRAGITVRLITGDHFETAFNIAHMLRIATDRSQVANGHELPSDDAAIAAFVKTKTVFARVLPNDKFRILKALQTDEIVGMTGDGVNDVPALSNAHVGIAMGSGSDIAKDASDMVLLDNNFATVIRGVHEGRIVYNNIRRMVLYLLSATFSEVLTLVLALLLGIPLPLTAVMVLWVNLITDTALVIPLGLEPAEGDEMKKRPRSPNEPLLTRMFITRIVLVGITGAIVTLIPFYALITAGYDELYAQTVAFMVLIALQWVNAFNVRSERVSLFQRAKVINYKMIVGLGIAFVLQMLVMFGPLGVLFNIQPVAIAHLLIPVLVAVIALTVVVEIHKYILRKTIPANANI